MYIDFIDGIGDMRIKNKEAIFDLPFFLKAPSRRVALEMISKIEVPKEEYLESMNLDDVQIGEKGLFIGGESVMFRGTPVKIIKSPYCDVEEYLKVKIGRGVFGYFNVYEDKVYYLRPIT